ncbi:hypothetical protein SeLEV6574_g04526 [Synchytrium endobioticum]|uniref:Uncharacterized protein n=1 Tax=Synchytrium endobioticum TaxID=286115 RepID=A0A507CYW6_9FUNG|nr:hypothetical protein SeLEV6574_g04526 [Synchytrium endobioticum]
MGKWANAYNKVATITTSRVSNCGDLPRYTVPYTGCFPSYLQTHLAARSPQVYDWTHLAIQRQSSQAIMKSSSYGSINNEGQERLEDHPSSSASSLVDFAELSRYWKIWMEWQIKMEKNRYAQLALAVICLICAIVCCIIVGPVPHPAKDYPWAQSDISSFAILAYWEHLEPRKKGLALMTLIWIFMLLLFIEGGYFVSYMNQGVTMVLQCGSWCGTSSQCHYDATLAAGTQCSPAFVTDYLDASNQWTNRGWIILSNLVVQVLVLHCSVTTVLDYINAEYIFSCDDPLPTTGDNQHRNSICPSPGTISPDTISRSPSRSLPCTNSSIQNPSASNNKPRKSHVS